MSYTILVTQCLPWEIRMTVASTISFSRIFFGFLTPCFATGFCEISSQKPSHLFYMYHWSNGVLMQTRINGLLAERNFRSCNKAMRCPKPRESDAVLMDVIWATRVLYWISLRRKIYPITHYYINDWEIVHREHCFPFYD